MWPFMLLCIKKQLNMNVWIILKATLSVRLMNSLSV